MMFGTLEISVSNPPTLVNNPSTTRNPSSRSVRFNFVSDTPVRLPMMIIAVTLLSIAEKTTVRIP